MNNWSLNRKIWTVIGVLSFAFVASTAFSLRELMNARDTLNEISGVLVKRDQLTSDLKDSQRLVSLSALEMILRTDDASIKKSSEKLDKAVQKLEKDLESYKGIASAEGKTLADKYMKSFTSYLEYVKTSKSFAVQNKTKEATDAIFAGDDTVDQMRETMLEMNKVTAARLEAATDDANAAAKKAIWINSIVSSVSIFLSILIAFFVLRAVTRAIAAVVKNLSDSSIQVSGAATQIASSAEELSQAATEQAASLEETAASVEEMNSMVAKNSENAKSAEETSGKSQEAVTQGKEVIRKMMDSMEAINRSSEGMAETVKVIEQIDKKTKVINEIVNKTELLSFNASVEAARAGEHGKGFAVVAEEVGNLARMSGAAAEEIASLLEESISKVNQMVQDTKKNVDTGTAVTRECGDVFEEVVTNVTSVSGMATEISSASQEQSRGCGEITKAMTQLDQMTQQNAATSEECASAAEELSAQAEALKNAVTHLVVTVNGSKGQVQNFSESQGPVAMAPVQKKTVASKTGSQNVVPLKGPRSGAAPANPVLKKASGDAPHYDNDGFKDV